MCLFKKKKKKKKKKYPGFRPIIIFRIFLSKLLFHKTKKMKEREEGFPVFV